jgi:long-chain fatty acid transport protein
VLVPVGPEMELHDLAALTLDGEATYGFAWNVGALYDIGRFRFGAAYRHSVETTIEGDATFDFIPTGDESVDPGLAGAVPADQRAEADVPFPAHASIGVAVRLAEAWNAEVNLNWTGWSIFEELPVRFDDPSLSRTTDEDYEDTLSLRSGVTFQASEKIALRAGYYVDDTPSPDAAVGPLLPDARRHGFTGGLGYASEGWRVDLFEMLLVFEDREIRTNRDGFDGDYAERAWVFGVSVGYTRW